MDPGSAAAGGQPCGGVHGPRRRLLPVPHPARRPQHPRDARHRARHEVLRRGNAGLSSLVPHLRQDQVRS